ncbi:type I restriction enzyme HsdR N-terminal domain-containing protein [Mucilaginibacter terrae]|uniref:Restriction endonuclease n=1 Tax=Mucilaginibacter terrae TaxID=1955052 RepID=A0ABU3GSY2_9SPHI|nr:type I restriction enzyme HsdR N-terminal domain-containing protein [Mucilaginibacter terrae]MDT3402887.1 hypothetical protein [Mucilaginibacter terrae]
MKEERLFNVLKEFDFNLLNDPEFKEDSVREEVVLPIIKGLGYSAVKPYQVIRSRNLLHPFVSIGSKRRDVYITPDYLFEVNDKPAWILDAKSPSESITKSHHVEQAYSYAIHNEVRANYFSLCNGREFVLYNILYVKPLIQFPVQAIPLYWDNLKKILAPPNVFNLNSTKLAKDLGLHLQRLGFDKFDSLFFPDVPITQIGQLDSNMFSFSSSVKIEETSYVVTFDFDELVFNQLKGKIPQEGIEKLSVRDNNSRQVVYFGDAAYKVTIECQIGQQLEENNDEIFQPLVIKRIIS